MSGWFWAVQFPGKSSWTWLLGNGNSMESQMTAKPYEIMIPGAGQLIA